jgi:hypothetical protein
MTFMETPVQSGWTVCDSTGKEIGTVVGTDGTWIQVKKSGLMGGTMSIPRDAIGDIETGRVELSLSKDELEARSKR